jgi:hypothetical protein
MTLRILSKYDIDSWLTVDSAILATKSKFYASHAQHQPKVCEYIYEENNQKHYNLRSFVMNTQINTLDTIQHSYINSHCSKGPLQNISRENYVSRAFDLWSPRQTPLVIDYANTNQFEEDITDIYDDTINLNEEYQWLTCYIWLPEEYDVTDVDPDTILLNGRIKAACFEFKTDLQLLIVKFPWSEVKELLEPGEFEFACEGQLFNGTIFDCNDTVTVVEEEEK